MRFKFDSAFFRMLLALVLVLVGALSAEAQCVVQQIHKLLADDGEAGYYFGGSVAISGTTAIVGNESSNYSQAGTVYLFDTTTGQQIFNLVPSGGNGSSYNFGASVGISGTTAIVGAPLYGDHFGAAYLFDTMTGQQIAKLHADDATDEDHFGSYVGISGTTAIVSALGDDDNGSDSGSAYLFDTTTGQQIFKLLPDDGAAGDGFYMVAISGTIAIVGAHGDDDNGENSGSAYLFDTTTGKQIAKLFADDAAPDDRFGRSVAISGTTAIVGAHHDDDNGENSGSAYLFDTTTGQQTFKLLSDDGAANDQFGFRVAVDGIVALVGAHRDDDNGEQSGSAYLFDTTTGQQIAKLLPDDGEADDFFARFVAISGSSAIVGAYLDDDNGENSGSAYLFDVSDVGNCEIVVNADQFNVFRGFYIGGDLSDTFESDDSYLKFNPGLTINSSEAPVWLIFDGTLPSDSPASLETVMESNAGTPGLTGTLESWNWTSMAYDVVDVSETGFNNDVVITVDLSSGITDYAQPGTGAVRTRIGWRKTGLTINSPWEIRLDQMVWIVE